MRQLLSCCNQKARPGRGPDPSMGRGEDQCSMQRVSAGKAGAKNVLGGLRSGHPSPRLLGHSQEVGGPRVPASTGSGRPGPGPRLTVVLALDEGLPLSEPLHADTVDDAGRLLGLECLVQLGGAGPRGGSVQTSNPPRAPPWTLRKHRTPRESFEPPDEFKKRTLSPMLPPFQCLTLTPG